MSTRSKKILVIHDNRSPVMRLAIAQHLRVLEQGGVKHEITYHNTMADYPQWNKFVAASSKYRDMDFDAIILHNTFLCFRWHATCGYKWKDHFDWLRDAKCVKIAMPQDEYDHAEILDEWLFDWGVDAVISNFRGNAVKILYPLTSRKAAFYHGFTGYIDESAAEEIKKRLTPIADRTNDIVYRATKLPYWFGSHGQLKHSIAGIVKKRAEEGMGLVCDISTSPENVIVGEKWLDFLASGKATIGCESGSSVVDWRGETSAWIRAMLRENPSLDFASVSAKMPEEWDLYRFFAISPRHFEAVITKTCQILVEGEYDGVLEAGRHYIPVKRDMSNLNEVLEKVMDDDYMQGLVDTAYEEVYLSGRHTYKTLAETIELAIEEAAGNRRRPDGGKIALQTQSGYDLVIQKLMDYEYQQALFLDAILLETKNNLMEMGEMRAAASQSWKTGLAMSLLDTIFRFAAYRRFKKYLIVGAILALLAMVTAAVSALATYIVLLILR